jgi:hypothetical protein
MHRSTVRTFAFAILALLGAPVAMHSVVHDLHDDHERQGDLQFAGAGHGDHQHPVLSSVQPSAPAPTRTLLAAVARVLPRSTTWKVTATTERNVVSCGALRMDDDVGLQPLLSTFLI